MTGSRLCSPHVKLRVNVLVLISHHYGNGLNTSTTGWVGWLPAGWLGRGGGQWRVGGGGGWV